MNDADFALHNALRACFGESTKYLNCYFHVQKNLREWHTRLSSSEYKIIMEDISSIHYSRSDADFDIKMLVLDKKWRDQNLASFADYVQSNLLVEPFNKWQCYHSLSGYAKTNNPVENFNGDFKKTYTQRKIFHILEAINLIFSSIRTESMIGETVPVSTFSGRRKIFERIGKDLFSKAAYNVQQEDSNKFLIEKLQLDTKAVDSDEELDTESNYIEDSRGSCNSVFNFGHCLHIVILQEYLGGNSRRLVNRTVRRPIGARRGRGRGLSRLAQEISSQIRSRGLRGRPRTREIVPESQRRPRGRPKRVGPALSFD